MQQPAMDPSQLANPIALALSVPAHLMTCWRLMSRAPQGQRRYCFYPSTMTVKTSSMIFRLKSRAPLWWMMVWKMKSEAWYLNINFLDGHASPTGYLSSMLFFKGLIYSRHLLIAELLLANLLNFSLSYHWDGSLCLNKVCPSLMALLFYYLLLLSIAIICLIKNIFSTMKLHCYHY